MKTIEELIASHPSNQGLPPIDKEIHKPHHINLKMTYNGGKRGRKTEEEKKELEGEYTLKIAREKVYLFFD